MSWKATAYVKPLKAAPGGEPLTRSEKLLLLILADYHNDEQRAAWPSGQTLARDALLSLRYVRKLVLSLRRKGLVCTSRRLSPEGDLDTTRYHFHELDCDGSEHEGGSELSSPPPRGVVSQLGHYGSEPISSLRGEPGDTTVVNCRGRGSITEPQGEPPAEPQREPPHTHAQPPLFAGAGEGGGVCVKSKYSFDERLAYARNRAQIQNPEGFAASRRAAEGEFDEAIGKWQEGVEHPGGLKPERDVSGCPDCHGSGWWYPEGVGKGTARCRHPRLDLPQPAPALVPP